MSNKVVYSTVKVTWGNFNNQTILTLKNKTFEEVIENAEFFGWKKPQWWQFWKSKLPRIDAYE